MSQSTICIYIASKLHPLNENHWINNKWINKIAIKTAIIIHVNLCWNSFQVLVYFSFSLPSTSFWFSQIMGFKVVDGSKDSKWLSLTLDVENKFFLINFSTNYYQFLLPHFIFHSVFLWMIIQSPWKVSSHSERYCNFVPMLLELSSTWRTSNIYYPS